MILVHIINSEIETGRNKSVEDSISYLPCTKQLISALANVGSTAQFNDSFGSINYFYRSAEYIMLQWINCVLDIVIYKSELIVKKNIVRGKNNVGNTSILW